MPRNYIFLLIIFVIYLLLRGIAWKNVIVLEDHDSVSYLSATQEFLSFELNRIINLDPDSSLFYPFVIALVSFSGWSAETSARFASYIFSIVLFVANLGIGFQLAGPTAISIGLLLLATNPEIIKLSFSVLTEPSFVATVYLGFWFLWLQYKNPTLWGAMILGIIFGLAFLNRLEGILFIAFAPLMLTIFYFWQRPVNFSFKLLVSWTLIFVVTFSLIACLQVWRVSEKMGTLSINGRQVWSLLLQSNYGENYEEKICGLHFSPDQINIGYLKKNAQDLKQIIRHQDAFSEYFKAYILLLGNNWKDLYFNQLPQLIGIFPLILFSFGLFSLYQSYHRFEIILILSFIVFGLIAPMLHNVVIRHIFIIAPIILLVAGIGVDFLVRSLLNDKKRQLYFRYIFSAAFVILVILGSGTKYKNTFFPKAYNQEYSPAQLKKPIEIIKNSTFDWQRKPVIADRKGYLAYYVGRHSFTLCELC